MLKMVNLSFSVENANRLVSTLLCELGFSYVQQSQRYVRMNEHGYYYPDTLKKYPIYEEGRELINQAFELYQQMTKIKDGVAQKGRPKKKDYAYGIPIEDARYILPLACKTNLVVAMSGTQLFDLIAFSKLEEYQTIMAPLIKGLTPYLSEELIQYLSAFVPDKKEQTVALNQFYEEKFRQITDEQQVICFHSYKQPIVRIGVGAVTSTNANPPSVTYARWGEELEEKATQVSKRVMGYGHFSISEQARTTFGMMMSLISYHQYIRHRLPLNHRESFYHILQDANRKVVIPESIANSPFKDKYLMLVEKFKNFRISLFNHEVIREEALLFLLNCDQIKVISSTNARMDCDMMKERLCMNAQWEIRNLYLKKLQLLYPMAPEVYQYAGPSCFKGRCTEGKLSCGNPKAIKELLEKAKS